MTVSAAVGSMASLFKLATGEGNPPFYVLLLHNLETIIEHILHELSATCGSIENITHSLTPLSTRL